jgi:hypothetical protein
MPVDFHVTPLAGANDTWAAEGHYYNDDGTVYNLDGNGNFYLLNVTGSSTAEIENINVTIMTLVRATNFNNQNSTTDCSAINNNDFLGNITFYNAKKFNQTVTLNAFAISISGVNTSVGTAAVNTATDRLETNLTSAICLSSLLYISLEVPYVAPKTEIFA